MDTTALNGFFSTITTQRLVTGLAVFVVGALVINVALRLFTRHTENLKLSLGIRNGMRTALKIVLWALLLIGTAGTLGVNISSLVAMFSVFSLAVSLAVQGTLSNIAGGLQVLAAHPFAVGDYVKIGDSEGTVADTGLVYTKLLTIDNLEIFIPNSQTAGSGITNYTAAGRRMVEIKVGLSYESDTARAKEALLKAVEGVENVMGDPAPFAAINDYGDSSINYVVRFWTTTANYKACYFGYMEKLREEVEAAGLEFPYPQMDVHMKK